MATSAGYDATLRRKGEKKMSQLMRVVITFGLISGGIFAVMIAVVLPLAVVGTVDFDDAEIAGFTSMIVAFLFVFFGIRKHREQLGGTISFGKAFKVGILITLIASAVYVGCWLIVYYNVLPDFADKYASHAIQKLEAKGASAAELQAERVKMDGYKKIWDNPITNAGMTFLEVFPIGLIVTLVSAGILRKRPAETPAA